MRVASLLAAGVLSCMASVAMSADAAAPMSSQITTKRIASGPACRIVEVCGPEGCFEKKVCGCPDRYSCAPLYGAYGPYGGTGYWGAYTPSGWGY